MAEVINLRLARKARARTDAAQQAAENRALHGLTKAERQTQARERERLAKVVDGARRESED